MGIPKITASEIKSQIKTIFESKDYNRKGRIEILTEIGNLGKDVISNLNTIDGTIYEIVDDMETAVNEYNLTITALEDAETRSANLSGRIENLDLRIEELESKGEENLTEEEREELSGLYLEREGFLTESNSIESNSEDISLKLGSIIERNASMNAELIEISSAMEDYSEVGDVIRESAEEYGRPEVAENAENVMQRNETDWFGMTGDAWASKTQKFINASGYGTNVNGDALTYYDNIDHEFIAEYDILEKKGGNQVGGELRAQTVRVFSYGQTISTASEVVKNKADAVKRKDLD